MKRIFTLFCAVLGMSAMAKSENLDLGAPNNATNYDSITQMITFEGSWSDCEGWWIDKDLSAYDHLEVTIVLQEPGSAYFQLVMQCTDSYATCGEIDATWTMGTETTLTLDLAGISEDYAKSVKQVYFQTGTTSVLKVGNLIAVEEPTSISSITADPDVIEVARYNVAGQKIAGEQPGINIIVYSDGSSKKVLVK